MPTYVLKGSDLMVFPQNDNDGETCNLKCSIIPRLLKPARVCYEKPRLPQNLALFILAGSSSYLAEYCTFLKLKQPIIFPPIR